MSQLRTHAMTRAPFAILCCLAWHFGLLYAASAVAGIEPVNEVAAYFATLSGLFNGLCASWLGIEAFVRQRVFWTALAVAFVLASAFFGGSLAGVALLLGASSSDFSLVDAGMIACPATTLAIALAGLVAKAVRST